MGSQRSAVRVWEIVVRAVYLLIAQTLYWAAVCWRRMLLRTTFIAVTGSHGKTTTKELLAAMLAPLQPTFKSLANQNTGLSLTLNVLRVRPRHRFAVIEVGVGAPGEMRRLARLVRPDVAVMLAVLRTHTKTFRNQQTHAAEKAILLERLRPGGVAVLNNDDPLVAAMAEVVRGTVVRVGTSAGLDLWVEGHTSRWPGRLEFDAHSRDGGSCQVRMRLVGTHWCTSVAAALAAARNLGVPLQQAADAAATVEPFPGRMQPVSLPCGAVVLRDEYDGSIDTFEAGLKVMAEARAGRRVIVISDVSDYGSTMRRKRLAHVGRASAQVAEVLVFVGPDAKYCRRGALASGAASERIHTFTDLPEAADFLRDALGPGDVALLKGRTGDHLARMFFAQLGPIRCWKTHCTKTIGCDFCPELGLAPEHLARTSQSPPQ
ncbi:MAG: Mur ligase family protein [Thermoanaerobaculales bacterium]